MFLVFALMWFPLFRHLTKRISSIYMIVPYLQIVVVTGKFRLPWPSYMRSGFSIFSALNLNLNLTLHQCYFDFSYEFEWSLHMLMPFIWVSSCAMRYLSVAV